MNQKGQVGLLFVVGFALFVLAILFLLFVAIVPAGKVGIQDTFGNVSNDLLPAGFHIKSPITGVVKMSVQIQKYDAEATSATNDLQDASTKVSVNYHLDSSKAIEVYKTIGEEYAEVVLTPAVQEAVKAATAQFNAEDLIQTREAAKAKIEENLKKRMVNFGIIVDVVNITDFKFSEKFTQAIEAKVTAQQSALEAKNKLEQIQVEADQARARAQGEADALKITADAQAYQLEVINNKLTQNPLLVQYKAIEKWNGSMPQVTGGVLPFVGVDLNQ